MSDLLDGLRVIDLTHVLAGPYCTYQLSLLGAEVTRIEQPGAPDLPRVVDQHEQRRRAAMGAGFIASNANKRSLAVDISTPDGQAIVHRLVEDADVVIENFRPGVLDRHGLGAKTLTEKHPRLIYCSISGFGQTTSWKHRPAYDDIIQAMSGLMAITGTAKSGPVMAGFPIIDYISGLMAAFAICAAARRQALSGQGEILDVAMLDAALSIMGPVFALQHIADMPVALRGNLSFSGSPFSGLYHCAEGSLIVAANTPGQVEALLTVLRQQHLLASPEVRNWRDNPGVAGTIRTHLHAAFQTDSAEYWETALSDAGVPCGMLRDMPQMLEEDYTRERNFVHRTRIDALDDDYPVPGVGFLAGGCNGRIRSAPPSPGEHSREVLREIGMSEAEIQSLAARGVLGNAADPGA